MNLQLSKRGDYVVRSALSLARAYEDGSLRKIREVVAEMGVPQTYASQILNDLVKAGIAESKAGKDGGYKLRRDPQKISLLEVVEAAEGPLKTQSCSLGDGPCRWDSVCPLHEMWSSATQALRDELTKFSLLDLLKKDLELEKGLVKKPADSHRAIPKTLKISDWIQLETSLDTAFEALIDEGLFSDLLEQALIDIDSLRQEIEPLMPTWQASRIDTFIKLVNKENQQQLQSANKTKSLSVSTEVLTHHGHSIHLEATATLKTLGIDRCELKIQGRLRPLFADKTSSINDISLKRLSDALIRSLLRKFSLVLETK